MRVSLLILLILMAACASLDDKMASWVGHHRDELVIKWGPPAQESQLSDGGAVLLYLEEGGSVIMPMGNTFANIPMGTCRMQFATDRTGKITSWSYRNC